MDKDLPSSSDKPQNGCNFFKQIEESLWRCSFCGETVTINPYDWENPNWREDLKPGWKVYKDKSDGQNPLMGYTGDSKLAEGFFYAPNIPKDLMKNRVSIEEVRRLRDRRRAINSIPLADIEWVDEKGQVVPVDPAEVKAYKFTGLNNFDFVELVLEDRENFKKFVDDTDFLDK